MSASERFLGIGVSSIFRIALVAFALTLQWDEALAQLPSDVERAVTPSSPTTDPGDPEFTCNVFARNNGTTPVTISGAVIRVGTNTTREYLAPMELSPGQTFEADLHAPTTGLRALEHVCVLSLNGEPAAFGFFTVNNVPPVANAGLDRTVLLQETVTLFPFASTDANSDPLTFSWELKSVPIGSTSVLDLNTPNVAILVIDVAGEYEIMLTVDDGEFSSTDTVVLTVGNSAPEARPTAKQAALSVGFASTLDGSNSFDIDGDSLTYAWRMILAPQGSEAVLIDATTVMPTIVADLPGFYAFELIVNDGDLSSAPRQLVLATNTRPVADPGGPYAVAPGEVAMLDGGASSDINGDQLTFVWGLLSRPDGSTAEIDNPDQVMPTLPIDLPGDYVVQLIVNDGVLDSLPVTTILSVNNLAPVADAGMDQEVELNETVVLDGSGSTDGDGDDLTYFWSITTKPAESTATLSASDTVAPEFTVDVPGMFVIQLMVSDGFVDSEPTTVVITATQNLAPVADAGPDISVSVGEVVQLDGGASSDANGDPLDFRWSLTTVPEGSEAVLDDAGAVNPSFEADLSGDYVAQLIVNDGDFDSAPDTVMVVAGALNAPPQCGDAYPSRWKLWPANRWLRTVRIKGVTDPDGDHLQLQITQVTQDEPVGGRRGRHFPDAIIKNDGYVKLRAERHWRGDGRVYVVRFTAADEHGAECQGQVKVQVPKLKWWHARNSGQRYDSTVGSCRVDRRYCGWKHHRYYRYLKKVYGHHYPKWRWRGHHH